MTAVVLTCDVLGDVPGVLEHRAGELVVRMWAASALVAGAVVAVSWPDGTRVLAELDDDPRPWWRALRVVGAPLDDTTPRH